MRAVVARVLSARATYYVDTTIYPLAVTAVTALTCRSWQWIATALFGFVLFTLAEYWIHRTALHRWFYHGTHEDHHLRPEEYVFLWYVPFLFIGFFLVMPAPVFAGFTLSYCWFIAAHHVMHHCDLGKHPLIRRYAEWHLLHHKFMRCNFGITHPFWDMVFGTYRTVNSFRGAR